jgi:CubicO group peptidase (beta-lactamase class C family)
METQTFVGAKDMAELMQMGFDAGLYTRAVFGVTHTQCKDLSESFFCFDSGTKSYPVSPVKGEGPYHYKALSPESIYDIASVTKTIVTLAWHAFQGSGKLRFCGKLVDNHTRVAPMLGMRGAFVERLTVEHLHSFYAQFSQGHPTQEVIKMGFDELCQQLLCGGLEKEPGTDWKYSNPHAIVLGLLMEKLTGKSLMQCVDDAILGPLHMNSTLLDPRGKKDQVVMSELLVEPGIINDPTARHVFQDHGRMIGSAGLFSSSSDLLILLRMLLNQGVHDNTQVIASEIVQNLHKGTTAHFGNGIGRWSMFRKNLEDGSVADDCGRFKLGHTGAILVQLPRYKLGYTVLTDFLMIQRTPDELKQARQLLYRFFASCSLHAFMECMNQLACQCKVRTQFSPKLTRRSGGTSACLIPQVSLV